MITINTIDLTCPQCTGKCFFGNADNAYTCLRCNMVICPMVYDGYDVEISTPIGAPSTVELRVIATVKPRFRPLTLGMINGYVSSACTKT